MAKIVADNNPAALGFLIWRGHPDRMPRAHSHTDIEFNYVLHGEMHYFFGGRFMKVPAHRLTVFWAGIPHQLVRLGPGTEVIWVTLPLAWLMQWRVTREFRRRLLAGELLSSDQPGDQELLERWAADFAKNERDLREILLLEIEARLRRIGRARQRRSSSITHGDQVERVTRVIGERYAEALTIDDIATAVKLHPNYLMRMFKRRCGMSLWEYVTRLRVSHAQRLLLMTERKLLDVALESGFGSVSRFHAAFRRICRQTPRAYRMAQRIR